MSQKRIIILVVALLVAMTWLTACGGGDSNVVKRPVVRLQVGGQTYAENVYSYCWPESEGNLVCDMDSVALIQPIRNVPVTKGDEVRFTIQGESGPPSRFTATLLDGPGGVQDLGTTTEGVYNVELQDNLYRVQVDVEYDEVEGQSAYVSYVFGLQVAGIILPTPTPVPTNTPTATFTPTATPTPTATMVPTDTPTIAPPATAKPTLDTTTTSTPFVMPVVTEAVGPSVETPVVVAPPPTMALPATVAPPVATTPAATVTDLGVMTITGTVRLVSGGTAVAVAGAQVRYDHQSTANPDQATSGSATTDSAGRFVLDPIFLNQTDQIVVMAEAPGYEPQSIARSGAETWDANGVFDFELQPAAAVTPETPAPSVTATPIPSAPALKLRFAGRDYTPVGYQFCQRSPSGERMCVELPADNPSLGRIAFQRGAAAQIAVDGPRPSQVRIEYLSDDGLPTGQPETRPGDNTILLTITPEPGTYIMAIQVTWGTEDATYFFRVAVSD